MSLVDLTQSSTTNTNYLPSQRRIRHLRGLHLRNITLDHTPTGETRIHAKVRSDTKDMIGLNTPLDRQRYLQGINKSKFLNVFYVLEYIKTGETLYVSEIKDRCLDADFQEFRLDEIKYGLEKSFRLKIWASKYGSRDQWILMMNYVIDMKYLLYWGSTLESFNMDTKNTVIVELSDGVYILPIGVDINWYKRVCIDERVNKIHVESLSLDSLMKLKSLNMGVEDLQQSKRKLELRIRDEIQKTVKVDKYRIHQLERSIAKQKEINAQRRDKLEELVELKRQRLKLLMKRRTIRETEYRKFGQMKEEFAAMYVKHENTLQDLVIERSKVIKTVINIFPKHDIEKWLECKEFEILPTDLSLKNITDVENASDSQYIEEINAGFGYVCHMVSILSRYLAVPLRYQIRPFGSSSYIVDRISQINQRKVFPLFNTSHFYRFQYGVMLLSTNIGDVLEEAYHY